MSSILFSDKIPYLLTVLIGLAAYQLNNLIQLQADSPILTYNFKVVSQKPAENGIEKQLECELQNLSRKSALRELNFHIAYRTSLPSPKKVMNPEIVPVAPSAILPDSLARSSFDLINEYRIPVIQPNASYVLKLTVQQNPDIKEHPKLYLESSDNVRLEGPNFEVFLLKNQAVINLILLLLWLFFILAYVIFLPPIKKTKQ
jgi:hypothetical protein